MYEKMMEKVMSENVTLKDWIEFRNYIESLPPIYDPNLIFSRIKPTEEINQAMIDRRNAIVKAAHHVASKLSEEDIAQDAILELAYDEIYHPEKFS